MYEEDFVKQEIVDLNIEGYEEGSFKYKPTTAGQENEWLEKYMKYDNVSKEFKQDFAVLNKLKLGNVVKVPYSDEQLKKITGLDKSWDNYSVEEKWVVFGQLKSVVFDRILDAINKYDKGSDAPKKV